MEPEGSLPHSQVPATWASSIQSLPPHPTSWWSVVTLSCLLRLGLPSGLLPSGFATKTLYTPLLSPIRATCPAPLILLNFVTRILLGEQYGSLSYSCSFLHSPVTLSLLGPNITLSTVSADILRLRSSLNVSDQVSHPHKTAGKIYSSVYLNPSLKYTRRYLCCMCSGRRVL